MIILFYGHFDEQSLLASLLSDSCFECERYETDKTDWNLHFLILLYVDVAGILHLHISQNWVPSCNVLPTSENATDQNVLGYDPFDVNWELLTIFLLTLIYIRNDPLASQETEDLVHLGYLLVCLAESLVLNRRSIKTIFVVSILKYDND